MRLLDKLLTEGFELRVKDKGVEAQVVRQLLFEAQLVVADNVAEYYWDRGKNSKEEKFPEPDDFPNVMLPFENTFIEARIPGLRDRIDYVGVLLQMKKKGDLEPYWFDDPKSAKFFADGVEWHMVGFVFYQFRGFKPTLISRFAMPVLKDGRTLPSDRGAGLFYSLQYLYNVNGSPEEQTSHHIGLFQGAVMHSLLTLSFMHCRNVSVRKETPPLPLSKKHEKRTGRPLLRYHVLQIDHMKQVLDGEGKAGTEGLKTALHICRGHFKHYGRDGKGLLFGKHVATVWIPMHTRGTIEEGVVVKDYQVK